MLRSGVQAVSVAPAHGGQSGGTWGGGGFGVVGGCSRSTSIVPGQELSWTQQESGGPFLKSDQLELLFSHPAHFTLLCNPPSSLADWYTGWNVIFLCLSYETPYSLFPPTHPTNLFSAGIKSSCAALFFSHLVHIKVTHERMVKKRKGPGTRQISLAFPLTQCFSFEFPHILLITLLNGVPDEVLFLWFFTWIPKTPGIHFPLFVFDFKVIWNGTCWNEETERSPGPMLDVVYQVKERQH